MKTAIQVLEESHAIFKEKWRGKMVSAQDIKEMYLHALREYATEAIKKDRRNIVKHVKTVTVNAMNTQSASSTATYRQRITRIDKKSIINAPLIRLP